MKVIVVSNQKEIWVELKRVFDEQEIISLFFFDNPENSFYQILQGEIDLIFWDTDLKNKEIKEGGHLGGLQVICLLNNNICRPQKAFLPKPVHKEEIEAVIFNVIKKTYF